MEIRDKLYDIKNTIKSRSVNIDDSLYDELKRLSKKVYNASISDIVNVALEEYIIRNKPTFYGKPDGETISYRNLRFRKNNVIGLNEIRKTTGISFTRLVNGAIYEFLQSLK